jgi:hypothetical protein
MSVPPEGQVVTGTRQLDAWRRRVLPPVEELATDLWSIPIREQSGAWIAMHPDDHAQLARPEQRDPEAMAARRLEFLCSLGATESEAAEVVGPAERYAASVGSPSPTGTWTTVT